MKHMPAEKCGEICKKPFYINLRCKEISERSDSHSQSRCWRYQRIKMQEALLQQWRAVLSQTLTMAVRELWRPSVPVSELSCCVSARER